MWVYCVWPDDDVVCVCVCVDNCDVGVLHVAR